MTQLTLRPLSVGEILDASFAVYRGRFRALAGIAVIVSAIPTALAAYLNSAGDPASHLALWLVYYVLAVSSGAYGTAATVFVVSEAYLGRDLPPGKALQRATGKVTTVIAVSMLLILLVMLSGSPIILLAIIAAMAIPAVSLQLLVPVGSAILGLVFVLVLFTLMVGPPLVVGAGLCVAVPSAVIENLTAGNALSRAWSLSRGFRIKAAIVLVPVLLLLVLIGFATLGTAQILAGRVMGAIGSAIAWGIVYALQVLVYPVMYSTLTVLYYDLRVRKEAFDLEVLESALQRVGA